MQYCPANHSEWNIESEICCPNVLLFDVILTQFKMKHLSTL